MEDKKLDYFIYIVIALIILLVVWFVFAKVLKNKKPKEGNLKDIPVDIEEMVMALGGKSNIKESFANGSKITFFVEKDDLVNVKSLKELGASGLIQSTGKMTVIMGKYSEEISRIINDYQ